MKHLKTYKIFESNENVEFLVEDLFGVEPIGLRDVITSLLDELEVPQFDIRYTISSNFNLDKDFRHLVNSEDFSWQYDLFVDSEKGLHKKDYDMWLRFITKNNMPYNKFNAAINVFCYKQHSKYYTELHKIIDFINQGFSEYGLNVSVDKKFSGFLSPDFGTTGFMLQLIAA